MHFFLKAIIAGSIILIVGECTSFIIDKYNPEPSYKKCSKNYFLEISLFLTGFISYLLLEYGGLNNVYCDNYCTINRLN